MNHGFPRRIISDRDNAFLGKKFTDFTKSFGIELAANPAYSKWMSGTVERFHGSIASVICHYVGEKRDNWDDFFYMPYLLIGLPTRRGWGRRPSHYCMEEIQIQWRHRVWVRI